MHFIVLRHKYHQQSNLCNIWMIKLSLGLNCFPQIVYILKIITKFITNDVKCADPEFFYRGESNGYFSLPGRGGVRGIFLVI